MTGLITPVTREVTIAVNAVPMTTATASSMTLPRRMNCLKPLSMGPPNCSCLRRDRTRRLRDEEAPDAAGAAAVSFFDDDPSEPEPEPESPPEPDPPDPDPPDPDSPTRPADPGLARESVR